MFIGRTPVRQHDSRDSVRMERRNERNWKGNEGIFFNVMKSWASGHIVTLVCVRVEKGYTYSNFSMESFIFLLCRSSF